MSEVKASYSFQKGTRVEIVQGDLTKEQVDAIINAANSSLAHGGGVAAAIVRAGGEIIQDESEAWFRANGPVTHEEPAYTSAGKLPCRYVIHAVGPIWGEGEEDRKLEETILGCLKLAEKLKLRSIAFPAISTGIYDFPKDRAARVFFETFLEYFAEFNCNLEVIRLTLWDEETVDIFMEAGQKYLGSQELWHADS